MARSTSRATSNEWVDAAGTWTYEWDVENRPMRVLKNGAEVTRYAYDPIGRRIEKVAGTTTKTYTCDGDDVLREVSSAGRTLLYLHGPGIDEPLASENQTSVRSYFHGDGLGSVAVQRAS